MQLCSTLRQHLPASLWLDEPPPPTNWSRTWHAASGSPHIRSLYEGDPWISLLHRATVAQLLLLFSTVYAYTILQRAPPGLWRLLLALPVLAVVYGAPFLFSYSSEPLCMMTFSFISFRLTFGKVMGLVLGRGALALDLSYPQFCSLMLAPIMPAELNSQQQLRGRPQPAAFLSHQQQQQVKHLAAATSSGCAPGNSPGGHRLTGAASKGMVNSSRSSSAASITPDGAAADRSSDSSSSSRLNGHGEANRRCCGDASMISALGSSSDTDMNLKQEQQEHAQRDMKSSHSSAATAATTSSTITSAPSQPSGSTRATAVIPTTLPNLALNLAVVVAFCCYSFHGWRAALATAVRIGGMWFMWRAMDLVMNFTARTCEFWWGLALAPQFYYPLGSTSLSDFWGRRWNLSQGLVLKHYVYQPFLEGHWLAAAAAAPAAAAEAAAAAAPAAGAKDWQADAPGACLPAPAAGDSGVPATTTTTTAAAAAAAGHLSSAAGAPPAPAASVQQQQWMLVVPSWRRQAAASLTFLVSGLEHELYRWYMTNNLGYHWLLFFSLQGPVMAAEKQLKKVARRAGLQLHPRVSPLAVLMVLGVMADAWFWPVVTDRQVVGNCRAALREDLVALLQWSGC